MPVIISILTDEIIFSIQLISEFSRNSGSNDVSYAAKTMETLEKQLWLIFFL